MQLIGLARLGRDAEARTVGDNVVANLSLAFDYYDPKAEKKRSTTWVDAALWGKQAEAVAGCMESSGWTGDAQGRLLRDVLRRCSPTAPA